MTDARHTVQEHAEQAAPASSRRRRARERVSPQPTVRAGGAGRAPARRGDRRRASTRRQAAARRWRPAHAEDADEKALRGDVDELVAVAAQRDEYLALAQRTQADFENYRKRVAKEAAAAQRARGRQARQGAAAGARQPRPCARSAAERDGTTRCSRACASCARSSHAALARAGHRVLLARRRAVRPGRARGDGHRTRSPARASGTVVEVYQPGYRLGASIIRPARVLVAA